MISTRGSRGRGPLSLVMVRMNMGWCASLFSLVLLFAFAGPQLVYGNAELRALMEMKAALDPENRFLSSWNSENDPCTNTFEGIGCNEHGNVVNISLQGKGLSGRIPPAVSGLKFLSGLYLHYNSLSGEIPREISNLTELSDLYLNNNNLSGSIPPEIGEMANLQVLQLCYNQLTGSIPTQLASLKKLSLLALQFNQFSGAIPASLGELNMLRRLDLSFNRLFGSIPAELAEVPQLKVLDVRNNTLSGVVPPALKKLNGGFQYGNNSDLCGIGFPPLRACTDMDKLNGDKPEPFGPGTTSKDLPESANFQVHCNQTNCSNLSKTPRVAIVVGVIATTVALTVTGLLIFSWYRRRKQKISSAFETSDSRLSTDQPKEIYRRSASPLVSLEYSNGWDPLADGRNVSGFSQEVLQSFRFNLEEVESATQHFSEVNLLGKSNFSAMYKGILRDGSLVAIKSINKTSCKMEEGDFLKGLNILTSLRHENLVGLKGFCCSRGRGECFLIYEFVPNGNLSQYLDLKEGDDERVLEWSTRVSIINGIAKGIEYLHSNRPTKPALVHQNVSAEKVLIDQRFKPLLSDSGLQNLLADDIVFSVLKASAAMGYLAPEYTTTGRFTEKSDIYAFGVIVLQILSGRRMISQSIRVGAESSRYEEFMDKNLDGKFPEAEAAIMTKIALACTHETPNQRPNMDTVIQELSKFGSSS